MFDVGFAELAVIGMVALLVLGPERLPRAARATGLYLRRARAAWYSVRGQIERELAAEDLKRATGEVQQALGLEQVPVAASPSLQAAGAMPEALSGTAPDTAPDTLSSDSLPDSASGPDRPEPPPGAGPDAGRS